MRDGRTRKTMRGGVERLEEFLARNRAALVVVSGRGAGMEHALDRRCTTVGRGPGVDLAVEDATMSRAHAAFEYADGGFRVRDLGSTNGTLVNGSAVENARLKHGDRVALGDHVLQLLLEERAREPQAYELPEA